METAVIDHGIDAQDRGHIEVGGICFTTVKIEPFEEWLQRDGKGVKDVFALKWKDREKLFLRWKWGFKEDEINQSLDFSERALIRMMRGMDFNQMQPGMRYHFEHKMVFERFCNDTRKRLGLAKLEQADITPEMRVAMDVFQVRAGEEAEQ